MAQPGEFTLRAFLNGKLDLSQAEAVADLISSDNEASHQIAMQQMRGGFSSEIAKLRAELLNFASLIELELDFGEEDVEFANRQDLEDLVNQLLANIRPLVASFRTGNAVKNGVATVIVGRWGEFTTFIPIYYVDDREHMYIMANAEKLPDNDIMMIDIFMDRFAQYARDSGGEVSIFEFLDNDGARDTNQKLVNFLRALQRDITKTNIPELDLDLDFNSGNIMIWNGNMVMVDW
jgi:hypothetical protein